MPRSDIEVFYSDSGQITSVNAFLFGAAIVGDSSAVSGFQTSNPIEVDVSGADIFATSGNVISAVPVTISTIPGILIAVGQTHNMGQYIIDPNNNVTDSEILDLNTAIATYSSSTKLLTGVAVGVITDLRLRVTF